MIITETIEKIINKKNIEWYRNKGYQCELRDKILVNIHDLSKGSYDKVECICDNCGKKTIRKFCEIVRKQSVYDKTYCQDCASTIKLTHFENLANNGIKKCKKCNRELPANTDYYYLKCDTKDGFCSECKECKGKNFTNYLTHIPKEGYKFCVKCDKELPKTTQYFPIDKDCKDGMRNVCRCCGKDGHYLKDDYIQNERWTEEDYQLLKSIYKDYTNEELVNKFFPNRTCHALDTQADQGGFAYKTDETKIRSHAQKAIKTSKKLKGRKFSLEHCLLISERKKEYYKTHNGSRLGVKASDETKKKLSMVMYLRGQWKGDKNPRYIQPLNGNLNGNWKGGITGIYYELRSETKDWQQNSMKFCNYHCVLTGGNFNNVHHLKPFKQIVEESFTLTNLDKREKVLDYNDEEILLLRNKLKELHIKYGYGVCLCKPIHELFHKTYGYLNNTYEQFLDFVEQLKIGNFDNWLQENNIKLSINLEVIDYIKSNLIERKS